MADTYVTQEELTKFSEDLKNYVLTAMENEEVNFAQVVKEYVESQTAALEAKLVNDEKWLQVKNTVDSLLEVFDANKDGVLAPEEILSKIGEIKASIDAVAKRVDNVEASIKEINTEIGGIKTDIDGVKTQITDVAANAQKAVKDLETKIAGDIETAKTAVEAEINTQVSALQTEVKANVTSVVDGIEKAMLDAFKSAQDTVADRMGKVREIFGLSTDSTSTSTDTEGDGAAV